jgi:hypothetical protein
LGLAKKKAGCVPMGQGWSSLDFPEFLCGGKMASPGKTLGFWLDGGSTNTL